jgi:alpha-methylacyl-CoA racemase
MKPIDGIRILDLTAYLPGPYATQLLADLGAEVIKVETKRGDTTRFLPPHIDGVGAFFAALHEGKQSIAIDLKNEAGLEVLFKLVEKADVLIEGFRPGVLQRLGASAEKLHSINPKLVIASLSGYGHDGPYRDQAGHDTNYMGYAGTLSITVDDTKKEPVQAGVQIADMAGAMQLCIAVLAAIYRAEKSGHGSVISCSMFESALSLISVYLGMVMAGQEIKPGQMLLSGALPSYRLYKAKDGRWLTFGPLEPKFWFKFCAAVGKDEWISRHFDDTLVPELQAFFESQDSSHWLALLEKEACVGPVLSLKEVLEDPHATALGMFGKRRVNAPWTFDGVRPSAGDNLSASPGSDRDAVLTDVLGWNKETIEDFEKRGSFG